MRCVINIDHIRFSIKEPRGTRPDLHPRAARVASARKLIQTSNGGPTTSPTIVKRVVAIARAEGGEEAAAV